MNCTNNISNVAGTNADPESGSHPRVPRRGRGGDLESGVLRRRGGREACDGTGSAELLSRVM